MSEDDQDDSNTPPKEEDTFVLENAKSARSSCKKCREKILKDGLRIGHFFESANSKFSNYFHVECFALPPKLKKKEIDVPKFVQTMLQDQTTDKFLDSKDYKSKLVDKIENASVKTPKKRSSTATTSHATAEDADEHATIAKLKSNLALMEAGDNPENYNEDDDEEETHQKKKQKKVKEEDKKVPKKSKSSKQNLDRLTKSINVNLTDVEKESARALGFYIKMTNDELQDILRWNQQMVSGKKVELLERVVDGHLRGRLSLCPTCHKGKLKLDPKSDMTRVVCPGYFDEDSQVRVACLYSIPIDAAPRAKPWFTEEPSEEEKQEMEKQISGLAELKTDAVLESLLDRIHNDEWDVKSNANIKKMASHLVKICRELGTLNVPEEDGQGKMEIGKILLQNKTETKHVVLKHLVEKLGIKPSKAEVKAREATMESQCKCPANGPLYAAFSELMNLFFKEGNSNAGASYRKVVNAIRELDFEVTADNAKNLSKGKTKIAGVGKGSSDKMYEFVTTGKIEKLEEKKALA